MSWHRVTITTLVWCFLTSVAFAQVVTVDFNDISQGDLAGQGGGSGWMGGSTFTSTGQDVINVVAGDLTPPVFTNYALTQTGTP